MVWRFLPNDATQFEVFRPIEGTPGTLDSEVIVAITRGPNGRLWVGTEQGINWLDEEGVWHQEDLGQARPTDLLLDSRNRLWVATSSGVYRWGVTSNRFVRVDIEALSPAVVAIDETMAGGILVAARTLGIYTGGVVRYSPEVGVQQRWSFPDSTISSVLELHDGTVWVGTTDQGVYAIANDETIHQFSTDGNSSLDSATVRALFEDAARGLWVGTDGGGVYTMSPRQPSYLAYWHEPNREGSLPPGAVSSITRDRSGRLWIGTDRGVVAFFHEEEMRWSTVDLPILERAAIAPVRLVSRADGSVWVADGNGVFAIEDAEEVVDHTRGVFPESAGVAIPRVSVLYEDTIGRLWVGTERSGVHLVESNGERGGGTVIGTSVPVGNDHVSAIVEDLQRRVWIGTSRGLFRLEDLAEPLSYRYDARVPTGISSDSIRSLYVDDEGVVWVGTNGGGIDRYDNDSDLFTHLSTADGLPSNTVQAVRKGVGGVVWVVTRRGLAAYEPLRAMVRTITEPSRAYGGYFQEGIYLDTDRSLLIGVESGIVRVTEVEEFANEYAPPVHITSVALMQREVKPGTISYNEQTIIVEPEEAILSFRYVGLDYEHPAAVTYSYRLLGFEQQWINAGTHSQVSYTQLKPGRYEFMVRAANRDGRWSTQPAFVSVEVLSPWYRTWWAFMLYTMTGLTLLTILYRGNSTRLLTNKNHELEHAVYQLGVANDELERLSVHDPLTGIFNRRYFDLRYQEGWSRALRSRMSIALLMVDVDNFKQFNDTFGHVVGDRVLVHVAEVTQAQLPRSTDFVARYGGEEFIVMLYDTDLAGARVVAERIRSAVEREISARSLPPVTVSVGGTAAVAHSGVPAERLIVAADEAMYRAKDAGRNAVWVHKLG